MGASGASTAVVQVLHRVHSVPKSFWAQRPAGIPLAKGTAEQHRYSDPPPGGEGGAFLICVWRYLCVVIKITMYMGDTQYNIDLLVCVKS